MIFNSRQSISNTFIINSSKVAKGSVHIRRHNFNSHFLCRIQQLNHLIGIIHFRGHVCCHKLCGIMGFEPGSLICHQSIGSGMTLIKPVLSKFFQKIKDFNRQLLINSIFHSPIHKVHFKSSHDISFFLTHCTAEHITLGQGKTADDLTDLHHLFLINNNTIGFF